MPHVGWGNDSPMFLPQCWQLDAGIVIKMLLLIHSDTLQQGFFYVKSCVHEETCIHGLKPFLYCSAFSETLFIVKSSLAKCYLTLLSKDGNLENVKTTHQKFSVNKVKLSAPAFNNLVDWVKGLNRLLCYC